LAERFEQRVYLAELHRLRGVFLTALGAGETEIEASFYEAIRIAKKRSEGIAWIEDGIRDYRATGAILLVSYSLALKAEALYLAHHTSEALEAISEAEALVERFKNRYWSAELHRLRAVFLAALGADETQIEASLCEAIKTAQEQKSVSLEKTRRSHLCGISQRKSECVRRTWIPATSLLTSCSALVSL
jgi:hypothetical protein